MMNIINKARKNKKAFTLIELVIVILIIAILAVVLIPQLSSMTNKAKMAGVQEDFREFQIAAQTVAYEHSGFGTTGASNANIMGLLNENLDTQNALIAAGTSTNADPWNVKYDVVYCTDVNGATEASGDDAVVKSVVFISGGPNGVIDASTFSVDGTDDLATKVTYEADGSVTVKTAGFSLDKEA